MHLFMYYDNKGDNIAHVIHRVAYHEDLVGDCVCGGHASLIWHRQVIKGHCKVLNDYITLNYIAVHNITLHHIILHNSTSYYNHTM